MISDFDKLCNKILTEVKTRLDPSCQKGYKKGNPKTKTIGKGAKKRRVNNCVKENYPSRITSAPSADRLQIDDNLKGELLDHGVKIMMSTGTGLNGVIESLGKMIRMDLKFSDNAKKALYDYLSGEEFRNDLNTRMDEEDERMTLNDYMRGESVNEKNAKCTGPTKKASSTSKGKKYMKCVKSDSGGYKRIHWGQKGAKVTGKSGNTKRKKSFRARHKCSTAKSNTPRGQACKDW